MWPSMNPITIRDNSPEVLARGIRPAVLAQPGAMGAGNFSGHDVIVRPGEMVSIPPNVPHSAEALEDTLVINVFTPPRRDWEQKQDAYLRESKTA